MYDLLYELKEWIAYLIWHSIYNTIQKRIGLLMTLVLIFFFWAFYEWVLKKG